MLNDAKRAHFYLTEHLFHVLLYHFQSEQITLTDFCGPTPAVNQIWNSTAALVCHVLHTAPCGALQTQIEIVTWQQDPLFALRLTHLYTHLFIGLFE